MLLDVLFRVHADPIEHLGCRSLARLEAFQTGYLFCHFHPPAEARDFPAEAPLREWLISLYQLTGVGAMGSVKILHEVAPNDETAFDLFFKHLETVLAGHPEISRNPRILEGSGEPAPPVSVLLEVLSSRPKTYLNRLSPGTLRALLDGARLGCLEQGHVGRADLDGFEH
jgi:hypothetical protein